MYEGKAEIGSLTDYFVMVVHDFFPSSKASKIW